MLHTRNVPKYTIENSRATSNHLTKIAKSNFYQQLWMSLSSESFGKCLWKMLFAILVKWFEVALEKFLLCISVRCEYVTCSLGSREVRKNNFGTIWCLINILRTQTRADGTFFNLILTLKAVWKERNSGKKCCFSWLFGLHGPLENFL